MSKPIYIDPRLRRLFERRIHRTIQDPTIWGNQPINRLFLLYGQNGSGMEEALIQLTIDYSVPFRHIKVTKDTKKMVEEFNTLDCNYVPLLIIRKGHLLRYHQSLFLITHNLVHRFNTEVGFIIVISEDVPDSDEHPFWEQFKVRIPMGLPKKDDYKKLLEYYFQSWSISKSPAVGNIDLDFEELAICCDYATPKDVKHFVRRVIGYVIDQYPENRVTINMDLLKQQFMYNSLGVKELYCITNKDGHAIQSRYDPEGQTTLDAPTINEAYEREQKRAKKEEKEEEKQSTMVYLE